MDNSPCEDSSEEISISVDRPTHCVARESNASLISAGVNTQHASGRGNASGRNDGAIDTYTVLKIAGNSVLWSKFIPYLVSNWHRMRLSQAPLLALFLAAAMWHRGFFRQPSCLPVY